MKKIILFFAFIGVLFSAQSWAEWASRPTPFYQYHHQPRHQEYRYHHQPRHQEYRYHHHQPRHQEYRYHHQPRSHYEFYFRY